MAANSHNQWVRWHRATRSERRDFIPPRACGQATANSWSDFECGQTSLGRWLRAYASQSQRRDVARTFVATDTDHRVAGYYTLVAGQIEQASAPATVRSGVSHHYPIPICLIARLAVDQRFQGRGLGSGLLREGLGRVLGAAERIGIRAVIVDAIDEEAAGFYRRYGFESATADGLTLMVPLATVRSQLR